MRLRSYLHFIGFLARYNLRIFRMGYYAFYPLMGLIDVILEFILYLFSKEKLLKFSPSKILKEMEKLLD